LGYFGCTGAQQHDHAVEPDADTANWRDGLRLCEPEIPRFGGWLGSREAVLGLVIGAYLLYQAVTGGDAEQFARPLPGEFLHSAAGRLIRALVSTSRLVLVTDAPNPRVEPNY